MTNIFKHSIFVALVVYFCAAHAFERQSVVVQDNALEKRETVETVNGDSAPVKDSLLMFHNDNSRFPHANRFRRFAIDNMQHVSRSEIPVSNVIETRRKAILYFSPDDLYLHKSAKRAVPLDEQHLEYRSQMKLQSLDQSQLDQISKQSKSKLARFKRSFVPLSSYKQQKLDIQNSQEPHSDGKNLKTVPAVNVLDVQDEAYRVKYNCPNESDCPLRNSFRENYGGPEHQPLNPQTTLEVPPNKESNANHKSPAGHHGQQFLQSGLRWFPAMPLQLQQQYLPNESPQGMQESYDQLHSGNSFPQDAQDYRKQMHPGNLPSFVQQDLYPEGMANQQSISDPWFHQPNFAHGNSPYENQYYADISKGHSQPDPLVDVHRPLYEQSAYPSLEETPRKYMGSTDALIWPQRTETLAPKKEMKTVKIRPSSVKIYTLKPGEPLDLPKEIAPYVHGFDVPIVPRTASLDNDKNVENVDNSHVQGRSIGHIEFQKQNHLFPVWGNSYPYEISMPYARNLMSEVKSYPNLRHVDNGRAIYY